VWGGQAAASPLLNRDRPLILLSIDGMKSLHILAIEALARALLVLARPDAAKGSPSYLLRSGVTTAAGLGRRAALVPASTKPPLW